MGFESRVVDSVEDFGKNMVFESRVVDSVEDFGKNMVNEEIVYKIGILALIIALTLIAIGLFCYIFTSLAYVRISKRRGIKAAWLSWIPVLRYYIFGKVANDYDKRNGVNRKWHIAMLIFALILFALNTAGAVTSFSVSKELVEPAKEMWGDILSDAKDIERDFEHNVNKSGYLTDKSFEYLEEDAGELLEIYKAEITDIMENSVEYIFIDGAISIASALLSVLLTFLYAVCLYKTFESTAPKAALFCFIISMLIPLACPICLFACRNKGYGETITKTAPTPAVNAAPKVDVAPQVVPVVAPVQQAVPEVAPVQQAAPEVAPVQQAAPEVVPVQQAAPEVAPVQQAAPEETTQQ